MADDRRDGDVATLRRHPESWATGDEPMTGPQAAYLRTLCRDAGINFEETLTKAEASKRIDALRRRTGREEAPALPEGRTAAEVLADHLHRREAGDLEADLHTNYDEHVVVLAASGVHYGHDGVRYLTLLLREELPEPRFTWRTALADGETALVEWAARGADETEEEGVDSYVIRNGRIVARTVHVRSWR
ncbi:MAG: DUF3072 domain-containing protein [Myxococcota bacterium]